MRIRVSPGDRIRMTGVMPNDPMPLPVGATGRVVEVNPQVGQVYVDWDPPNEHRGLIVLLDDPFEVVQP